MWSQAMIALLGEQPIQWLAVMYAITSTYACRQVKNKKMRDRDGEARKSFSKLLTEWKERTLMNKDDKKKG